MSVKIGHASRNEFGKAIGGVKGDQDGKEVCIREWYDEPWDFVLRPINKELATKSAIACEKACANKNIGYCQSKRNTLYQEAIKVGMDLSKVPLCDCDCSSLMHCCAIAGGASLKYGSNGLTTRTMVNAFRESGDYYVYTDAKYIKSDNYLKRGDILVKVGSHTAMVLENGRNILEDAKVNSDTVNKNKDIYIVQKGDTLIKIGKKININWTTIAKINKIKFPYTIKIGQVLNLKEESKSFYVRLKCDLNIRKSPNGEIVKPLGAKKNVIYTIVETKNGYGKLLSGAGWICIKDKYVSRV